MTFFSIPFPSEDDVLRPRNGSELLDVLLDGKSDEIPSDQLAETFAWLNRWGVPLRLTVRSGESDLDVITFDPAVVAHIRREVERDEAEDIAAERRVLHTSSNCRT